MLDSSISRAKANQGFDANRPLHFLALAFFYRKYSRFRSLTIESTACPLAASVRFSESLRKEAILQNNVQTLRWFTKFLRELFRYEAKAADRPHGEEYS